MMNYKDLRDELIKQNGGINIICLSNGTSWTIYSKTTWRKRTGVFLFPDQWGIQDCAALELFHLPSKKIKLSAALKGSKGNSFCDGANMVIGKLENGKKNPMPRRFSFGQKYRRYNSFNR
jgi:hypothetical protein